MPYGFNENKSKYDLQPLIDEVNEKADGDYVDEQLTPIKAAINTLKPVLLWENPNAGSSFSSQTVTIEEDLSEFNFVEIVYFKGANTNIANSEVYSTGKLPLAPATKFRLICLDTSSKEMWDRQGTFDVANNGINFGTGNSYDVSNKAYTSKSIVPYRIYGYKY